jgi:tRNA threonylcarbamoyladenosine biosynthesis protein TsaE
MSEEACRSLLLSSPVEMIELGKSLGGILAGGETLALSGDLGSGKTTFTKGLCAGLGLVDSRLVSSPTYVLEHVYDLRLSVHHYDAYRLASAEEFLALGFQEHLTEGRVVVVEWAEKVASVLPPERLLVRLSIPSDHPLGTHRRADFSGPRRVWSSRLERLKFALPAGR